MKNINLIKRNMDSLSFQQEFEGAFIGDINTYFPYSLTRDIINQEIEYAVDLSKITVPLFGFADIGRRRDFTAIVLLANINDKLRLVYKKVLKTQEEKEWNNQYVEFRKVLSAPTLVRFGIDNGFGQQLVETMCREKPSVVVPFTFTNDNKNEMFPLARKRMETKGIEMPEDVELINSLHLIQRTQSGNSVSYGSDKHTDEYGHADLAVALIGAIYLFERDGKPRALPRTIDSRPTRFGYANPKRVKR
jgi:phage FluMu gp28-like protein